MNKERFAYGAEVNISQLIQLLDKLWQVKPASQRIVDVLFPVCIWGRAGIGKTSIIQAYAVQRSFPIVQLALAQLEEMGDLLGMPMIKNNQTTFAPPSWVPKEKGPGILLIDDFNRADPRIINGIMQLLQEGKMMGWSLPEGWRIILTANPFEEYLQVNYLDEAILTRMIHFKLRFDINDWKSWAEANDFPEAILEVALTYPEIFNWPSCNPRTFAQLGMVLKSWPEWHKDLSQVELLAKSMIGEQAANWVLEKLQLDKDQLPLPTINRILVTSNFEKDVHQVLSTLIEEEAQQRLLVFTQLKEQILDNLSKKNDSLSSLEMKNIKAFLLLKEMPADIRFQLAQGLIQLNHLGLDKIFRDPELAKLIL